MNNLMDKETVLRFVSWLNTYWSLNPNGKDCINVETGEIHSLETIFDYWYSDVLI